MTDDRTTDLRLTEPHLLDPHLADLRSVRVGGDSPRDRGRARGGLLRDAVRRTSSGYAALFDDLGIAGHDQEQAAAASLDALRSWAPAQLEELEGVAEGARLDLLDVGRTIARTEILTLSPRPVPGECSTVAFNAKGVDAVSVSAQTWDWYARFVGSWHGHRVEPLDGEVAHAGLVEHGMTGKIGLNAAGVGVHLNILKHRGDAPGGVPVHAVLARVLAEARSVEDGLEIIRSAPTSSSSVITLTGADRVAMAEIGAGRVSVLEHPGWMLHTNHFLAEDATAGAVVDPTSTTHDRFAHLEAGTSARPAPRSPGDLLALLCVPPGAGSVAVLPDPGRPAHERVATLATVRIDPGQKTVRVSPGIPQHAEDVCLTYQL